MSSEKRKAIIEAVVKALALDDVIQDVLNAIGEETSPDDIFDERTLINWAEDNGFTR